MSERSFLAVAYESAGRAEEALRAIGELDVVDAAVVVKGADGRLDVRQTRGMSAGEGVVAGGTVGLLAGLLLGVPVGAALAGVVAGGGLGLRDTGIPDQRLRALGEKLTPAHALLCVLVERDGLGALRERLAPYGGEPVETDVSATEP